jgi:hypothetical protein
MSERFDAYCRRREQAALAATIPGYITRDDTEPADADSARETHGRARSLTARSTGARLQRLTGRRSPVWCSFQSRDGNTGAADPSTLGGGNTDLHLIYEGLSRVDADAVMAGAATVRAKDIVLFRLASRAGSVPAGPWPSRGTRRRSW